MRDSIQNGEYFEKYIASHEELLERIQEGVNSSGEDVVRKRRFILAKGNALYNMMKAKYSAGYSLEEVKIHFNALLEDMSEFWGKNSSILYMYDMMALSVLFEEDKNQFKMLSDLTKAHGREDALTDLYERYMCDSLVVSKGKTQYGKPYDKLLEIIANAEDVQNKLIEYLNKDWYVGNKQAFWYDSHKAKQDIYVGYWSFETAATVKILGVDDSKMRDMQYYPYDLVHYKESN